MTDRQGLRKLEEGLGSAVRKLLETRCGMPTIVQLANGEDLLAYDIAWGRDLGDLWEHATINASPPRDGRPTYFIYLSEVVRLRDAETGFVLIEQEPAPGEA